MYNLSLMVMLDTIVTRIVTNIVSIITKKLLSPLYKTLIEILKKDYAMLDDMIDTRMNNILSKYIQAKRNHEYKINQERQKEQFYLQKVKNLMNSVIIPAMESVCESFKKHSGIDCIVTSIVTTDVKNFNFSEKGNSVLFMTFPQTKQDERRCYVMISHDIEESFFVTCVWNSDKPEISTKNSKMDSTDITKDSICNVILDTIEKNFSREWSF